MSSPPLFFSKPKPRCAEQGMINRFRYAAFGSSLHMLRVWSARAVGGLRSGQVLVGRPILRQGLPNGHALVPRHHATAACADNTKHAPLPRQTRLHSRTPCPLPHIATYTFGIFSGTRKHSKREVQPWRKNGLRTFFHARQRVYRTFRSGESGFFGARVQHIGGSTEGVVKGHP